MLLAFSNVNAYSKVNDEKLCSVCSGYLVCSFMPTKVKVGSQRSSTSTNTNVTNVTQSSSINVASDTTLPKTRARARKVGVV